MTVMLHPCPAGNPTGEPGPADQAVVEVFLEATRPCTVEAARRANNEARLSAATLRLYRARRGPFTASSPSRSPGNAAGEQDPVASEAERPAGVRVDPFAGGDPVEQPPPDQLQVAAHPTAQVDQVDLDLAKACRRRSPSAGSSAGPSSDGASTTTVRRQGRGHAQLAQGTQASPVWARSPRGRLRVRAYHGFGRPVAALGPPAPAPCDHSRDRTVTKGRCYPTALRSGRDLPPGAHLTAHDTDVGHTLLRPRSSPLVPPPRSTAPDGPRRPSSTKSSRGTWRPGSRARGRPNRTGIPSRASSSEACASISTAGSWRMASPAPAVAVAGTIS